MNVRVPKNIRQDWQKIRDSYGEPASKLIARGLVDIASRGEHEHDIAAIPKKGRIGETAYNGKPLSKAPTDLELADMRVDLTPEEYKFVRAHLRHSVVPLTVPQAIGYLRLYYMGSADERVTVYNLG